MHVKDTSGPENTGDLREMPLDELDSDTQAPFPPGDDASHYSRNLYGSGATTSDHRADPKANEPTIPAHAKVNEAHDASTPAHAHPSHAKVGDDLDSQDVYREISRVRKRNRIGKRIAAIFGCVVLAVALAGGAYAWWFVHTLDAELAPDEEVISELERVLVPETPGEPFYVLVMGSDSREGNKAEHRDEKGNNERSDVMMLLRVDRDKNVVTMLSIPRDTPYRLPDGSYVKINEMFNHDGAAGAIEAVMNLTGLPVNHYAEVRISGLEAIVDYLGGVTVDVPVELTYETTDHKTVTVPEGRQTLNGAQAQIFARARHEFEDNQDAHRQGNVRQLLSAIINKVLSRPVTSLPDTVLQIANYVDTDYKTLDAVSLARDMSDGKTTMYSTSGPTNGDRNKATVGKWLCFLNPEGWKKVTTAVDSGKDPDSVDFDFESTEIPWTEVTDQPDFATSMAQQYYYG